MATYLQEDVEGEIEWLLANSYSGQLEITENSYSDGIPLEPIRAVRRIPLGVILPWEDMPGCVVAYTGRDGFEFLTGSRRIEFWGYSIEVHIGAGMNLAIPDVTPLEIMTRKVRRYEQALLELFCSSPNANLARGGEQRARLRPVRTRESPLLDMPADNMYCQLFRADFRAESNVLD